MATEKCQGNYVFTIQGEKHDASTWKKELVLQDAQWGMGVHLKLPNCQRQLSAVSPSVTY
jgi:hypothetical protein